LKDLEKLSEFYSEYEAAEFTEKFSNLAEYLVDEEIAPADYQHYAPFKIEAVSRQLTNRFTGESVRFLYGENGEFSTVYQVEPGGFIPFEHAHEDESEFFDLRSGDTFVLVLDGKEHQVAPGSVTEVPAGAMHYGWNNSEEEATFYVNFDDNAGNENSGRETFETYWMICELDLVDKESGKPDMLKMLQSTAHHSSNTSFPNIPPRLQKLVKTAANAAVNEDPFKLVS
jgi:uncharacterized cupin superfamily protein